MKLIKYIIVFFIIAIIIFTTIGCIDEGGIQEVQNTSSDAVTNANPLTPTPTPVHSLTPIQISTLKPTLIPSTTPVLKDLSEIALTLDDLPSGSNKHVDDIKDRSSIERNFILLSDFDPILLVCKVNSYSTIQKAKEEYSEKISGYSITSKSHIGDEGIEIRTSSGCTVVFRKANIIVEVDWLENYYISIGNSAVKYAKIVENRI